jgi:catechol 2,3-dioxygenase-like lactoylglutathione lyase family enzyme
MLLYTTIGTNDLPRATQFYDKLMAAMDQPRLPDWDGNWAGWGQVYDHGFCFCLCRPFDGLVANAGNGTMFAFRADSAARVRAFHNAALSAGGTDAGEPGPRPQYGDGFYAAYVRDPDGNKLAAVFHRYDPAADRA